MSNPEAAAMVPPAIGRTGRWRVPAGIATAIVLLAYLAQLATPLRMNTDAVIFLGLAASHHDGHGFTVDGHKTHFPPGYPFLVAGLERIGLGCSAGIVALNLVGVAAAAAAGAWIAMRWLSLPPPLAWLAGLLFLLQWATIKHATLPVSECVYAGVSLVCLAMLTAAERQEPGRGWLTWIAALGLALAAISVRLIGVALLPAVAWCGVILWCRRGNPSQPPDDVMPERVRQARARPGAAALLAVAALAAVAGFGAIVSHTRYAQEGLSTARQFGGVGGLVRFTLLQRCRELGSLLSNIPDTGSARVKQLLTAVGALLMVVLLALLLRRVRRLRSADAYLLVYVGILAVWPYAADVRFWVPVAPLVFGLFIGGCTDALARQPRTQPWRAAGALWMIGFAGLGLMALAYSTRISYAGRQRFSEVYGGTDYRDTYRAASHNGQPVDRSHVHPDLLMLLRRFGRPTFGP